MVRHCIIAGLLLLHAFYLGAQSWNTIGGNSRRDSHTRMPGPSAPGVSAWTVSSDHFTAWGNPVLQQGNLFVCARTQIVPQYISQVECRSLLDGSLKWTFSLPGGKLFPVGFDEYAVYVSNYSDKAFFSLDPVTGEVQWQHASPVDMFGGTGGIVFACNGDPIVIGKRIDRRTGSTIWATPYTIPLSPDAGYAVYGEKYYHWEGSIFTPKRLIALDVETGNVLYKSEELPGDGDQEWPLAVDNSGRIYIVRDGGKLYAMEDTGSGFQEIWNTDTAPESRIAFGPDGSLYFFRAGKIVRLDPSDGQMLDTSLVNMTTSYWPAISTDGDGRVFVANAEYGTAGKFYCLTSDLDSVLWQLNFATNYYTAIAPGKDGTVVLLGEGNIIKGYRFSGGHTPVADFSVSHLYGIAGETWSFTDNSSFTPVNWEWYFPGGNPAFSIEQNPEGIVYNSPGNYDVELIVSSSVGSDTLKKSCYIQVEDLSSIEEISKNIEMSIFPNPADEYFHIGLPDLSHIEVWEISSGKKCYSGKSINPQSGISCANWASGLYGVKVVWSGDRVGFGKLVIQH